MKKLFINRDTWAESSFYSNYAHAISGANTWVIPLMKRLQIELNVSQIIEFVDGNTQDKFIDELYRRKAGERIFVPSDMKRIQVEVEKELDKALQDVIYTGERMTKQKADYNRAKEFYENKINELTVKLSNAGYAGGVNVIRIKQELEATEVNVGRLNSNDVDERKRIVEGDKLEFQRFSETEYHLNKALKFVILNGDKIVFDEKAVAEAFGVYADNDKETKLYEKIKQLAKLINEVYGGAMPEVRTAFYIFFAYDEGKVSVNPEIKKANLTKFAKYI